MKKYFAGFMTALVICSVVMVCGIAFAAAADVVAVLRPDIAIYMDGKKMDYKDANGNSVTPVIINGSTYLPLRGLVTSMGKDVLWDEATQTITIGEPSPTNLLDVTGNIESINHFEKVVGESNLSFPGIGDIGVKYTSAIKAPQLNGEYAQTGAVTLQNAYSTLETSLLCVPETDTPFKVTFKIFDDEKNVALLDKTLDANEVSQAIVNITGVKKLRFEVTCDVAAVYGGKGASYFLNPTVK